MSVCYEQNVCMHMWTSRGISGVLSCLLALEMSPWQVIFVRYTLSPLFVHFALSKQKLARSTWPSSERDRNQTSHASSNGLHDTCRRAGMKLPTSCPWLAKAPGQDRVSSVVRRSMEESMILDQRSSNSVGRFRALKR